MDFLKGRCAREQCKYYHPPPQLRHRMLEGSSMGGREGGSRGSGADPYSSTHSQYGGLSGERGYGGPSYFANDPPHQGRSIFSSGDTRSHLDELAVLTQRHQDEETALQIAFQGQRAQLEQQQQLQLQQLRARQKNEQLDFLDNVRGGGGSLKRQRSEYDGSLQAGMPMMQPPSMMSLPYMDQSRGQPPLSRDTHKKDNTLQVCRDFQRDKCARPTCSFAHPSPDVKVDAENCVTVCMDFRLRSCTRDSCRFYHAPADKH